MEYQLDVELVSGNSTFSVLYFAVERNCPELVRTLCARGAKPEQRSKPSHLPLLAYCVLMTEYEVSDTTRTFITLLAAGADPCDLPKALWHDYLKTPARSSIDSAAGIVGNLQWCTLEVQDALCRNITLMQLYCLWKADKIPRPGGRRTQFARAFKTTALFEAPYSLIGQMPAAHQVEESVMTHLLFGNEEPLVLLFTGQSGHGKTELARSLGDLLTLKTLTVDCTEMGHESDMFGPKPPYQGHSEGSPLNNHLAEYSGRGSVVFLDEFDKTSNAVHDAFLVIFEQGTYVDRRNKRKVDCLKTIWILATNHGEGLIDKFCRDHYSEDDTDLCDKPPYLNLEASLSQSFIYRLGAPLAGRITTIIPFLPFTDGEKAVMASKYMLAFALKLRQPINAKADWFPGHTHLKFINDGQVAMTIAKQFYIKELGARSLKTAVHSQLKRKIYRAIQGQRDLITDNDNNEALVRYDVYITTVDNGFEQIRVKHNGSTELKLSPDKAREK